MANTWFQFKRFRIEQDLVPMKVGTDGVLLGAWVDLEHSGGSQSVLDIGTGSGLIALMAAQKGARKVVALEIDPLACQQAAINFSSSVFASSIRLVCGDFLQYSENELFDHLVCNPPFFKNAVLSVSEGRQKARHELTLSLDSLIKKGIHHTHSGSRFSIILPIDRFQEADSRFKRSDWFIRRKTTVSSKTGQAPIRIMAEWSRQPGDLTVSHLDIANFKGNEYTEVYQKLTQDFYLKF